MRNFLANHLWVILALMLLGLFLMLVYLPDYQHESQNQLEGVQPETTQPEVQPEMKPEEEKPELVKIATLESGELSVFHYPDQGRIDVFLHLSDQIPLKTFAEVYFGGTLLDRRLVQSLPLGGHKVEMRSPEFQVNDPLLDWQDEEYYKVILLVNTE